MTDVLQKRNITPIMLRFLAGVYPCARGARGLAHENEISDEVYPCARGDVSEPFQSLTASRSDPGRGRRPDVARGPARRQASH